MNQLLLKNAFYAAAVFQNDKKTNRSFWSESICRKRGVVTASDSLAISSAFRSAIWRGNRVNFFDTGCERGG